MIGMAEVDLGANVCQQLVLDIGSGDGDCAETVCFMP